ncbi:MAG: hypothetical protein K1X74_01800 [Pirellulales bacterium]|nr:hypothetical protein [Pirellulales bacterium]
MARCHLRIFQSPDTDFATRDSQNRVNVPLGEVLPLLVDAVQSKRTWLRDFEHDEVSISSDLYELILAYQHCRRPVA